MGKRQGIMLAYPFEERRITDKKFGWSPPYFIQPKLDGLRCRAVINEDGEFILKSSEGNEFFGFEQIQEDLRECCKESGITEFDGELYNHYLPFEAIESACTSKYDTGAISKSLIQYHIFDMVDSTLEMPTYIRLRKVFKIKETDRIKTVKAIAINNLNELYSITDTIVTDYEGFILREQSSSYVRRRSTKMLKFKAKRFDEYEIIEPIVYNNQKMVGAFQLNGFKVSAGNLSHQERTWLYNNLEWCKGRKILIKFQSFTEQHKPRFGITVTIDGLFAAMKGGFLNES